MMIAFPDQPKVCHPEEEAVSLEVLKISAQGREDHPIPRKKRLTKLNKNQIENRKRL